VPLELLPPHVEIERREGGVIVLRSPCALLPYAERLGDLLRRSADRTPDRTFLAEKRDGAWSGLTYAEVLARAESIAQSLIDRGLDQKTPLMILSGNSIDHALMTLGGALCGVPVAPVSPAYSLFVDDHKTLKDLYARLRPSMIFVDDPERFDRALRALSPSGVPLVSSGASADWPDAIPIGELLATEPTPAVREREATVGADSVVKYLFTSGSTSTPKGVITTHRMLCSNQQMIAQSWPFLMREPQVLLDWLPWHHCFGGSHNFNLAMQVGGTLYIDEGKPVPALFPKTIANLREISPTVYFNVPFGFSQLLPVLETDAALRERFFARLRMIFFAGAALPADVWKKLRALARESSDEEVLMATGWGSTETSPLATAVHFVVDDARSIGLPTPGVRIKMVPAGGKQELRVEGPNVTPGYLGQPDVTRAAFDEEGFYKIGDAGLLADPEDPEKGIVFDGRVSEDFKLSTGTWVNVGKVRLAVMSATGQLFSDVVVTGADRNWLGLMCWPNPKAQSVDGYVERLRGALREYNGAYGASSTRIDRFILLETPASIDAGEITDKGYINQRAVLDTRRATVELLYADPPGESVISL